MKVGIIGCGYIGEKRAAAIKRDPDTELAIVADVELDRARSLASSFGCRFSENWREVAGSNDVDIVVAATTNDHLAVVSKTALINGKHVLCEKPMARNYAEALFLPAIARKSKKLLKVGFTLRYHPAVIKARRLFNDGAIGTPLFARCRYGHGGRPGYGGEWRAKKAVSGGGELLDQGVHVIDLFNWFIGGFKTAAAFSSSGFWDKSEVEENSVAILRNEAGVIVSFHVSSTNWKNIFSLELFGSKGSLRIDGLGGSYGPEQLTLNTGAGKGEPPPETIDRYADDQSWWQKEWTEFISSVKEGTEPIGNGDDALEALKIIDALYVSDRKGRVIEIEGNDPGCRERRTALSLLEPET